MSVPASRAKTSPSFVFPSTAYATEPRGRIICVGARGSFWCALEQGLGTECRSKGAGAGTVLLPSSPAAGWGWANALSTSITLLGSSLLAGAAAG